MKISEAKRYLGLNTSSDYKQEADLAFEIGTMVAELRIHAGITQKELAKKLNTKQPSIARLENGSYLPSLSFLYKIAKSFNTYLIPPKFGLIENMNSLATTSTYTIKVNPGINCNSDIRTYSDF